MHDKVFMPRGTGFIIGVVVGIIMDIGLFVMAILWLTGRVYSPPYLPSFLYGIFSGIAFYILTREIIKMIFRKLVFTDQYIIVPSLGAFNVELGLDKKEIQTIPYADIKEMGVQMIPHYVLVVQCFNRSRSNPIAIASFSKRQIEEIIDEIILRANLSYYEMRKGRKVYCAKTKP
ncbi:MAG: hypothetical protein FWF37_04265 [Chloroflexi bacterium]|nr:hypothetical protein [Chloroflexota bacterium]